MTKIQLMRKNILAILFLTAVSMLSAQNVSCDFQQTKFIKASGKTFHSEGKLKLNSSSQTLEMNYTKPAGDYFIIEGKTIKVNIKGKKSVVDTEKNAAMRAQRNTLMNCITGDFKQAAADNNADFTVSEKSSSKVVTLKARKTAAKGYSKIVITYRKSDNLPTELVLEEFNGTTTTYSMTNITEK